MIDCLFCQIGEHEAPQEHPENIILFESNNFYVKPALGHFIQGYCLVISKEHLRTMAELEAQECAELERVLNEISHRLTALYKTNICIFEHGAVCPTNRAGACIDHAHMHIVSTNCDVRGRLRAFHEHRISDVAELRDFGDGRKSYIYYDRRPGDRLVYTCDNRVPSQFMRRLLCEELGMGLEWDWRVAPLSQEIESFVTRWRKHFPAEDLASLSCTAS